MRRRVEFGQVDPKRLFPYTTPESSSNLPKEQTGSKLPTAFSKVAPAPWLQCSISPGRGFGDCRRYMNASGRDSESQGNGMCTYSICTSDCLNAHVFDRASHCTERAVYKSKGKSSIKSADQSLDERQQGLVAGHYGISHRRGQAKDLQARFEVAVSAALVLFHKIAQQQRSNLQQ